VRAAVVGVGVDVINWASAYERYSDELARYARSRGFSHEEAEDVVSDVFVGALRKSYTEQGQVRAWLYCLLRSRMIDQRRKWGRRPELAFDADWDVSDNGIEAGVVDTVGTAEQLAQDVTRGQCLALWYFYVEDRTLEDVCRQMQIGQNAAKALLRRGRVRLSQSSRWSYGRASL
jgi:RNA polymerase sigma factor (sigma-70 family)